MVERLLAGLLRRLVERLPAARRDWGLALYAEAAAVPAGRERVRWLAGALRVAAGQAHLTRRVLCWLVALAAAVAVVRVGWDGGSTVPGAAVGRGFRVALVALLVLLPAVSRVVFGPVADGRAASAARWAVYGLVCALVPALLAMSGYAGQRFEGMQPMNPEQWRAEMTHGAWQSSIMLLVLFGAYAGTVLALTTRRSPVRPVAAATGAGAGIGCGLLAYAMTPFGGLHQLGPAWLTATGYLLLAAALTLIPIAAGAAVRRRTGSTGQGAAAGLWAGAAAALVATVLTLPTMALFPTHVPLKWANPDPTVPHGTPYELRMSVGDAAVRYAAVLMLVPLVGAGLGAIGADRRQTTPTPAQLIASAAPVRKPGEVR
jgi:hypothetical protein